MRRRDAKTPAKDKQLDLPFDRRTKTARTNGAEPLAVRIPDAVRMTGIGRSKLYQLIASGKLETIKIGRCTLVPVDVHTREIDAEDNRRKYLRLTAKGRRIIEELIQATQQEREAA